MEEGATQQQSSAFPAPPYYFQRYTQANLALLEKAKAEPDHPDATLAADELPFPLLALEPPPPVKSGVYWLFGRPWPFAAKVDQIRLIFINMHHILNEYRPHQARETMRLMMQEQLDKKKRETAAMR
ncbi:Mediator of RNA polymerase II transcription subunit 7, partial [Podila minutissima]